ncbi:MAG: alpha/beta hydrolase-fold protein, partial [Christensenellales bacterium]
MALFQIQNLRSKEIRRKISVNVLLPIDSHREHPAGEKFRTLYLLHGTTDNNMAWLLNTRLYELAEKYNLCVVLPSGENTYYLNQEDRFENWDSFFAQELPMLLRRAFPLSE